MLRTSNGWHLAILIKLQTISSYLLDCHLEQDPGRVRWK